VLRDWELCRGKSQFLYRSILRIAKLLNLKSCHNSLPSEWVAAVRRLVNREIKETGTSEDVPRTAAITQIAGEKKAPADAWHCCAVIYLGLPSPVAELAATVGGYRAGLITATFISSLLSVFSGKTSIGYGREYPYRTLGMARQ
jgi:hypothetical protein